MIFSQLEPPYCAVIFSTIIADNLEGYQEAAQRMEAFTKLQKGYLGIEYARRDFGITVSYWQTLADSTHWKNNIEHTEVGNTGIEKWHKQYQFIICQLLLKYGFKK